MREKRQGEDDGDQGGVVDAEVGEVLADPRVGLGKGIRSGHGVPVDELEPWAALREAVAEGGGNAGEEGAEGGGGDRRLGGGAGGGLGAGDGECRWGSHGWRVGFTSEMSERDRERDVCGCRGENIVSHEMRESFQQEGGG